MLSRTSIVWAVLLVVIGLVAYMAATPAAWGQCSWELLHTFTGGAANDALGFSVSGAGDVNNDGYDDLIVGAWLNDAGGNAAGRAYVYSGQTGALLWTFTGEAAGDRFGWSVSGAGDVNNDEYDDLIVGAHGAAGGSGRAYVFSGLDGDALHVFTGEAAGDWLGYSVSGAGDVNDDGYADLIVGACWNDAGGDDAGRAYVYSGQTGAVLWTFTGEEEYGLLGSSVSGAGDVNGDGYDDLIVGAPYMCIFPPCSSGWAYVYSGQTGVLLWTFTGEADGDEFGGSVSGAGDVNNDGYDDLIVGANRNDAAGTNAGRAYVFSGSDGDTLYIFTGEAEYDYLGWSVSGAGDVNHDGYDDLIVGAYFAGARLGRAYIYSGKTGALIWTLSGEAEWDRFGNSVSGAGDVNNDGFDDLIIGASDNDGGGTDAGRAYVYSGATGMVCFTGEAELDRFGRSVSGAGDVNNDGYADLIVGAIGNDAGGTSAGRAYVYSGLTGVLRWTFTGEAADDWLGYSVSGAGDVNNDGYDDLIVGAPYNDAGGTDAGGVYVYSGQSGALLRTFTGEAAWDELGTSVSGAGDVNNDGYADLIVGAIGNDAGGSAAGRAYVYSGQTGALLWTFTGEAAYDNLGWSVSGAGDVNNDGYDDLIVGAPNNEAGGSIAGRAYVYSGETGGLLWTFTGDAERPYLGYSVSGAGDVNVDGYDDVIVGVPGRNIPFPPHYPGWAYVYSGQTGALLWTFTGEAEYDEFGSSVSGAGDVNNDGYDDLIVGAYLNDAGGANAGGAYVYSGGSGALLCIYTGEEANDEFGYSVSGAGDVDNDGYAELIVGAHGNDAGGAAAGRAYVFSCQVEDPFVRGDVNGDGLIDLGDVLYIVSYLYKGGLAPDPLEAGDCDCDGVVDLGDVLYLISYLYKGGPAPAC